MENVLKFQSLFFWPRLQQEGSHRRREVFHRQVSILVFLASSATRSGEAKLAELGGFQSLFFWPRLQLAEVIYEAQNARSLCFNPCFSGLVCNVTSWDGLRCAVRFQSLFFWPRLQPDKGGYSSSSVGACFNPCFSGLVCNTQNHKIGSSDGEGSFNPCFSGLVCNLPKNARR